jgi:hypothetical protein
MAKDPLDLPGLCRHCWYYREVKFHRGGIKPFCTAFEVTLETEAIECTTFSLKEKDPLLEAAGKGNIIIINPNRVEPGGYA